MRLMKADDELCLCFHVTRRKVEQFIRARRPAVASQLSECYGAGTGCGWCRPFLQRLHTQVLAAEQASGVDRPVAAQDQAEQTKDAITAALPDATDYAAQRAVYRENQRAVGGDE